jgi:hypothetical protein
LRANSLSSIEGISSLERLQVLTLAANALEDLTPATQLERLRMLDASSNVLTSLPNLSSLEQLTQLVLAFNSLESAAALSSLPVATNLNVSNNAISDLEPLVDAGLSGTGSPEPGPRRCQLSLQGFQIRTHGRSYRVPATPPDLTQTVRRPSLRSPPGGSTARAGRDRCRLRCACVRRR